MKKVYVEPDMHRIELNLQENIAASSPQTTTSGDIHFAFEAWDCTVAFTGLRVDELFIQPNWRDIARNCIDSLSRVGSFGPSVPLEEVLRRYGH